MQSTPEVVERSHLPPRPEYNHDCVWEALVEDMRDDLSEWTTGLDWNIDEALATILVCVKKVTRRFDGYLIARQLEEDYNWPVDAGLVELIHKRGTRYPSVLTRTVEAGVLKNGVRSKVRNGDQVKFDYLNAQYTGDVIGVYKSTARVLVKFTSNTGAEVDNLFVPFERIQYASRQGNAILPPVTFIPT